MAKKPKQTTPLRRVRECSGLSQKEFANQLGFKFQTYHSLELGRIKLSDKNAYQIFSHTGASPASLDHKKGRGALAADGKPYSAESWKAWRKYLGNEKLHWTVTGHLVKWTHFLCDVARKQGMLRVVQRAIADALKTIANECGLEESIKQELAKIKLTSEVTYEYGFLREHDLFAKDLGFKDKEYEDGERLYDDAVWKGTITFSPQWDPIAFCSPEIIDKLKRL